MLDLETTFNKLSSISKKMRKKYFESKSFKEMIEQIYALAADESVSSCYYTSHNSKQVIDLTEEQFNCLKKDSGLIIRKGEKFLLVHNDVWLGLGQDDNDLVGRDETLPPTRISWCKNIQVS